MVFGWLWGATQIALPTYQPGVDSPDLQVTSLMYMFKRLRIHRLAVCPDRDRGALLWSSPFELEHNAYFDKLDATYNLEGFVRELAHDQHRILCDFCKNRFRSMCFLSKAPSLASPMLLDRRQRQIQGFNFVIMPLNTTPHDLVRTLAHSPLYYEHFKRFGLKQRKEIAQKAVTSVLGAVVPKAQIVLDNQEKNAVVYAYLTRLAFEVQVDRIYRQHLREAGLEAVPMSATPSKNSTSSGKSQRRAKLPSPLGRCSRGSPSVTPKPVSPSKIPSPTKAVSMVSSVPNSPPSKIPSPPGILFTSTPRRPSDALAPVVSPPSPTRLPERRPSVLLHEVSGSDDSGDTSDTSVEDPSPIAGLYERCQQAILLQLALEAQRLETEAVEPES
ncbi:hypothetical protein DICA4_E11958 [Diutina catenulata]